MCDDEKKENVLRLKSDNSAAGDILGTLNTHTRETRTFTKLGPYEAKRTGFNSKSFHLLDPQLESPNPLFLIHREAFQHEKKGLAKLIVNFPLEGQMSPKHAVTLGPAARRHANIPETAKYYVWSYPIDVQWRHYESRLKNALKECNCLGSPELMFLIMGGYVYFDEHFKIVSANALICGQTRRKEEELMKSGSGIKFGKPEKFPAKFLNQLTLYDRLKVVSWPGLNLLSNPPTFFAWLRPNEELVAPDRARRRFGTHGGFVFIFHHDLDEHREELTEKNCYFPVICNNSECCTEFSNYIRENKNPLSLADGLSLRLSGKISVQKIVEEQKESTRIQKKTLKDIDTPMMPDDDVVEESSEEKNDSIMEDVFARKASAFPSSINASDRLLHCNSLYNTKRVLSEMGEIKESEEDLLVPGGGETMALPPMTWGTTSILVKEFEGFAQSAKGLDGRVLAYFLASLPDNVLAKINLDQVILAECDNISHMRVNLQQVLVKNRDHTKRVEAIRNLVKRDRERNKKELDNCTLELLEKQFENHLKTGSDDEEGVENKLLFSELVRRFYYYVKPVAQAKAELEARIKEKHWLKLQYRPTLRIIRAIFTDIGNEDAFYSEYNYLAKIVINFIDPPRKIPFYEDGENSDFKEGESVIIRPIANENPRLAVIHKKMPNGDYKIKDSNETVKKGRVQRLFMWTCFRCKHTDQEMWRDIYPLKQWVSCTKCGLVTQKTLSTTRYQVRNLIRDSCYGGIYRGYDAVEKRDCAIKRNSLVLVEAKTRINTNDHVAEDIFKEIKYHFMVSPKDARRTPGILQMYDEYSDETYHYLVLEWADKGELFEYVVQNFQQPPSAFLQNKRAIGKWKVHMQQMFHEICLGVKNIHSKGIVHRDLSLENLLLIENKDYVRGKTPKVRPVICDFGLATEDQKEGFRDSVGKLGYMSPECLTGRYDGKKNDIWCLGIILVMMMIGAPPYTKSGDKAFRYLVSGPKWVRYLFKQYRRDHLVPEDAYPVLSGIFTDQKHRMTIDQVLETKYCQTAPFATYDN